MVRIVVLNDNRKNNPQLENEQYINVLGGLYESIISKWKST